MTQLLNKLAPFIGFEDDVLISADGYLTLYFKASLYDKDSVGLEEKYDISDFLKNVFESLQAEVLIQQYSIKHKSQAAQMPECESERSYAMNKDHIDHINKDVFYESKLYWSLSFKTDMVSKSSPFKLIISIFKLLARKITTDEFKEVLDLQTHILISQTKLQGNLHSFLEMAERLSLQIESQEDYFRFNMMDKEQAKSFLTFLYTMDPKYLDQEVVTDNDFSLSLPIPDIETVTFSGIKALSFNSAKPVYLSSGSIIRFVGKTKPDFWTRKKSDLMAINGEYIAYAAFNGFSEFEKITAFHSARVKTEQVEYNPVKTMLRGGKIDLEKENPIAHQRLQKLNEAKNWDIQYGEGVFSIFPFSSSPDEIMKTRAKIESSVISGKARMVWETDGLMASYFALIPTNFDISARKLKINSHQFSALSLVYTQNTGLNKVEMLNDPNPLCYFHTKSGERIGFSPYVGQKSLLIGVGETRGGKTLWKNFRSTMMSRWGSKLSNLDIDEGSYPIAEHFKDESTIYELPEYSYDPFSDYLPGVNDTIFYEHMVNLCELIASNPLTADDKETIEFSLSQLLEMPEKMHSFDYFISMLPIGLRDNFSRFVSGIHNKFFSSSKGSSKMNRINCFNLEKVYELKSLSKLSYYTLLFQIINDFKFRTPKHIPKFIDIDECHSPLKVKEFRDMLDNISRTGNKYLIGAGLFTQDVLELSQLEFWPALRTACATMVFFASPNMDKKLYKKTFDLSDYEISEIKSLLPRKEFYLIQREANISKRLEFNPSPYFLKKFTSNPIEIFEQKQKVAS